MPRILHFRGGAEMNPIKRKSIDRLIDGLGKYEDSRNAVKKSDFTDLKQFLKHFLNTPESKQRKKLAEEFKKRHLELYNFLKENQELISAETEISRIIQAAMSGETAESENSQLTNLFEMIGKSLNDI